MAKLPSHMSIPITHHGQEKWTRHTENDTGKKIPVGMTSEYIPLLPSQLLLARAVN